jgi:metal-responsive CopG/Arc/MetJ family transcriptional regulator
MRTIIDLPVEQLEALDGICRLDRISRAEAIRQAVTLLMRQRGAGRSGMAFGIWRGTHQVDGLKYQERLRREWANRAPARKL